MKIPHIASYRTDSARTQTFAGVCQDEWLHFHLVQTGALSGSHRRGWHSSDSTTSEGLGFLCTLCSPSHFCSIQAGMSLGPCTLYIYPSLGLFCQTDQPLDLRLFPQVSWQSKEPNFRCPRWAPQDTHSLHLLRGCCKLLSGAGGCRKKRVTELSLDPSKTQVKGCAEPRHGPAMLDSKGCSGSALPKHHAGGSPPPGAQSLRSPWGKK